MIDTKELRINNWVYYGERSKFPMQVETIGKDYAYLDFEENEGDVFECDSKDMMPIPISEKFIKNINQMPNSIEPPFYINAIEFDLSKGKGVIVLSVNNCQHSIGTPITYVHELQNLVFDLSKEELKIKREWL